MNIHDHENLDEEELEIILARKRISELQLIEDVVVEDTEQEKTSSTRPNESKHDHENPEEGKLEIIYVGDGVSRVKKLQGRQILNIQSAKQKIEHDHENPEEGKLEIYYFGKDRVSREKKLQGRQNTKILNIQSPKKKIEMNIHDYENVDEKELAIFLARNRISELQLVEDVIVEDTAQEKTSSTCPNGSKVIWGSKDDNIGEMSEDEPRVLFNDEVKNEAGSLNCNRVIEVKKYYTTFKIDKIYPDRRSRARAAMLRRRGPRFYKCGLLSLIMEFLCLDCI